MNNLEECVGDWVKEKLLGSGGFGMVVLWRNKISKEAIALKQCRWGHDHNLMTPRHRRRWELEIHIMKKLSHLNVVSAVNVPEALDVKDTELPLLAMEYCSGGDLRKVLNQPENCCGIVESEVRMLIHDVSAAIEYLHSKRIAHRDLKPENIVLQDINQKTRYKLIDLGYAKDLDEGSVCTSFVGTLQYLAPELFISKKYTLSVDFWSLGLVAVECITGLRPFLHNLSPVKWMPYVKQKSPDDICAYVGDDGNIVFSSQIFSNNQISRVLKLHIEEWLKLMLEWNPEKRGKGNTETVQVFNMLNDVLNRKVMQVFCVHLGVTLAYEISSDMTIDNLQNLIASEVNFRVDDQEIITPSGSLISSERLVMDFFETSENSILYAFRKTAECSKSVDGTLPSLIEKMFANPSLKMKYEDQRKAWGHSVLFAKKESSSFNRLMQACKVLMTTLITKNSLMNKSTKSLSMATNKLISKHELFMASLKQDIECYEEQCKNNGVWSKMMCDNWKSMMEYSFKIKTLNDEAHKLELKGGKCNTETVELQRSSYFKQKSNDNLENILQLILNIFEKIKKLPKERRSELNDNEEMVQLIFKFLKQRDRMKRELYAYMQKLLACRRDICEIMKPIESCHQDIESFSEELVSMQVRRQKDIWNLIKILVTKSNSTSNNTLTENLGPNDKTNAINSLGKDYALSGEMEVENYPDFSSMSLSDLVSHSSNESLKIMSDNRSLRHKMTDMSEALWQKHNEIMAEKSSMDFSFLNDDMMK